MGRNAVLSYVWKEIPRRNGTKWNDSEWEPLPSNAYKGTQLWYKIRYGILGVYEDGTKEEFAIGSWAHFTNLRKFYCFRFVASNWTTPGGLFTNFENNIYQINSRS